MTTKLQHKNLNNSYKNAKDRRKTKPTKINA